MVGTGEMKPGSRAPKAAAGGEQLVKQRSRPGERLPPKPERESGYAVIPASTLSPLRAISRFWATCSQLTTFHHASMYSARRFWYFR